MSDATCKRDAEAIEVLSKHGRTFRFASHLLGVDTANRAARLYRFCRWLDDLVDEGGDAAANRAALEQVRSDLREGRSPNAVIADFLALSRECGLLLWPVEDLLEGLERDTKPVRVTDREDLLRYAYQVAGTVGLWMHAVLGASDPSSRAHAIDLGVGMQLSNIARDVHEDAHRDRVYLPPEWTEGALEPVEILSEDPAIQGRVQRARQRAVETARTYYRSAESGLRDLPWRNRLAITTAALAYAEIGELVLRRPRSQWRERAVVGRGRKFLCFSRALAAVVSAGARTRLSHDPDLHRAFADQLAAAGGAR